MAASCGKFQRDPKLRGFQRQRGWAKAVRPMTYACEASVRGLPAAMENARSMEDVYSALADHLLHMAAKINPPQKYLVGLAGPPGAGKSTVAQEVARRVNAMWHKLEAPELDMAVAVPMDGFHLYRWQLDLMEDPKEAHARRGAPWTFDPVSLQSVLESMRREGNASLPSFDHGVGDPKDNDIFVKDHHRVVVVEGNYLLLQEGDWASLKPMFDETWYLNCDVDEAMERVERRHVSTGKPPDVARWRVEYNDRPNAILISATSKHADLIIPSLHLSPL
eukprot:TRINITY_DN3626_c0_g1_i1.p1 TRINITY_DN3626_c0_g1~~TRINITY_DN3626_c0_g1_i1.p1  ORF type:complete len:302 (+),score=50.08 TRINITY_DN3626_c0_g1_i1:74-907(+)